LEIHRLEKVKYSSSLLTKIFKVYQTQFLISVFLLATSSCGQTGPLYLPEEKDFEKNNMVERRVKSWEQEIQHVK